jgi:hypothetical protein
MEKGGSPGVSTIRSVNSALPEVKETGSQYQSSRSVLRMNGIVYIILEEYNTYYEMCKQNNAFTVRRKEQ